jgi:hypothetical protein
MEIKPSQEAFPQQKGYRQSHKKGAYRMTLLKQSMMYYLKSADFCPYTTCLKKVSICVPIIIPGILKYCCGKPFTTKRESMPKANRAS